MHANAWYDCVTLLIIYLCLLPNGYCQWFSGSPASIAQPLSNVCRTPLDAQGHCVSLKACPEVLEFFKTLPRLQATEYSRELNRRCGNRNTFDNYPIVCCTIPRTSMDVPAENAFIQHPTTPRTVQGSTTEWIDAILKINGEPCVDPREIRGFCKPLAKCTELLEPLQQNHNNDSFRAYIRASHDKCGYVSTDVCCPTADTASTTGTRGRTDSNKDAAPTTLPNEDQGCGVSKQPLPKIVGGEVSTPGTWPWAALLGYDIRETNTFRCGGTLITARHVVTAAHCLVDKLSFVRLGEFDLSSPSDAGHVDVPIEKSVGHPQFWKQADKRHDIAVVYLEHNVQFTDVIVPICLPSKDLRQKNYVDYNPFVVGWGKTQAGGRSSEKLRQLQIQVYNNSVCRNIYRQRSRLARDIQFDDTILCAGSLLGGKDSCQGDSGGPLMIPEAYKGYTTHFYLLGVVSYGIGCGLAGVPGIYTNVPYFMDWIEARVAES